MSHFRYSPLDRQCPASPIVLIILDDHLVWMNPYTDLSADGHDALRIRSCLTPYFHAVFIFNTIDEVVEKIKDLVSVGINCVLLIDGTFHEPRAIELRQRLRARRRDHAQVDVAHDSFKGLICDAADAQRVLQLRLGENGIDLRDVPFIVISWSTDPKRIDRMQTAGAGAFVEKCDQRHASGLFVALAHVLRHQHRLHADWMPFFLKMTLAQDAEGRSVFMNPGTEYRSDKCIIFPMATPPSSNSFAMC